MKRLNLSCVKSHIKRILFTEITHSGLSSNDCIVMISLLESGYSFDLIQDIIKDRHNRVAIDTIRARLENGEAIETAIGSELPRNYQKTFRTFIKILPLSKSLHQCQLIQQLRMKMNRYWLKQLLPSIFMLVMTFIGLILFKTYGIQIMMQMASSFHQDIAWLQTLEVVLSVSTWTLISLFILILFILGIYQIPSCHYWVLKHLNFKKNNLLVLKISYDFALYFNACIKQGIDTYQTIQILSESNDQILKIITLFINEHLSNGEDFLTVLKHTLLDSMLVRFIELSMYTNNVSEALDAYELSCSYLIEKKCKRSSFIIQLFAYCLIGILIICIYQALFLPMKIMSGL